MSRKLTPRQVIAPTWDYAMADRLIAWLGDCGYEIVEKDSHRDASLVPADAKPQDRTKLEPAH
ncbi:MULTISPECIES: hypothetical protein [unclassified Bradyrhizobium]|uniref:hypothetical protein n=1 Tax=unclassified Bradyrhizobium TaxID=2631580 RepID=UPI0028EB8FB3|nr:MULTISPECIES: hypothetical protein [unclassified Bradyrhizobium]